MKVLIISGDYPVFLEWFYSMNPEISTRTYAEQLNVRRQSLYGGAAFYAANLQAAGHEAWDVRINDEVMQLTWAREHNMGVLRGSSSAQRRARAVLNHLRPIADKYAPRHLKPMLRPIVRRVGGTWLYYEILRAQIQAYKPDIILNQLMEQIKDDFFDSIRPDVRLIVGQIAAPLPRQQTYRNYDLVISSLPNYVDYFRRNGVSSELSRLGFEPSVLEKLGPPGPERYGVTFVGSLSAEHTNRCKLLETVCESTEVDIWGQRFGSLSRSRNIEKRHRGIAWGADMFRILRSSRITINHHIGIAEDYANNMRLYEATGVGTMLLTDAKINLPELFTIDREVVTYSSPEECREKVQYYLAHDREREAIARAGQQRTLAEHTYQHRIQELLEIVDSHVRHPHRQGVRA